MAGSRKCVNLPVKGEEPSGHCKQEAGQLPNAPNVDSGVVWNLVVSDASDVLWFFCRCEVYPDAASLFASVRHEAQTLIRAHLLV